MSRLETVRDLIAELSPAERVQAMRWLTSTGPETPGVERTRGVCGGAACLLRTRTEDLRNAWAHYEGHRKEIDRLVEENEEE